MHINSLDKSKVLIERVYRPREDSACRKIRLENNLCSQKQYGIVYNWQAEG
jgi:hypothetical protein